jgi:phosphoribosylglycinamide formyltransferase-1
MIKRSGRAERWAIFISGRGSNLAALLQNLEASEGNRQVHLVVSSSPQALGLLRAKRSGVPTLVLAKPLNWEWLDSELRRRRITKIFLLGFMRLIPASFVTAWENSILNLHPSLLPAYPGLHSIELAYRDKADLGVSVHEVITEMDAGKLILQRRSLKSTSLPEYSLEQSEFLIHVDEQRVVKEAFAQWRP